MCVQHDYVSLMHNYTKHELNAWADLHPRSGFTIHGKLWFLGFKRDSLYSLRLRR